MATSRIVSRFQTGTYAVSRHTVGSYTDGRWVEGTETALNVAGVVQPVQGNALRKQLQLEASGLKASDYLQIWTTVELYTAGTNRAADVVTIRGAPYTVVNVMAWEGRNGDDHFECLVAKESRP